MLKRGTDRKFKPQDYPGFKAVEKVAIVFRSGGDDPAILAFAKKLGEAGKTVQVLGYIETKRKEITDLPRFPHFTDTEINWYGRPKSEEISAFLDGHYGVYISLNRNGESPLEFLSAAVKADFKIGIGRHQKGRFDLVVGMAEDTSMEEAFKEMEYYLNFINQA